MAESMDKIPTKLTRADIEFSHLDVSRFDEYRGAINQWYRSLPENNIPRDSIIVSRLSEKELKNKISDGTIIVIASLKTTNELVGSVAIGRPKVSCRDTLTSDITLHAVKTEYRRLGIGGMVFEEGVKTAKLIGAQRVYLEVFYEKKFQKDFMIKNGFIHTATKIFHKSEFTDNLFQSIRDYVTYYVLEKNIGDRC